MKNIFNGIFDFKNNFVAPSIMLAGSIIVFGLLIYISVNNFANRENSITVAGTAERIVVSDAGKLTISLNERNLGDLSGQTVSRQITNSSQKILEYLKKEGFKEDEIEMGNISLSPICELSSQGYENCSIGIRGQIANKQIVVSSPNIELVEKISPKLYNEIYGVNISNVSAEYLFNGLKDIRVEMLTEATKNAKERAEAVASAGGSQIGSITSLSSGVFQVTAPDSVQVDDYGAYDTSTIKKKITAVVRANFSIK